MEAILVPTPTYQVTWAGVNVTGAVTPYVLALTYTDYAHGQSDELELDLEDIGGGWKDGWYPNKGDVITARIGYQGSALVNAGDFQVEEFEAKGPPDTVHVRALATGVTQTLRTARSQAYEDQSLRNIAQAIATRQGMTVVGSVPDDIVLQRVTQNQERDLEFLKRVAEQYGQVFTVKGTQLIFMDRSGLIDQPPVLTLQYGPDFSRYSIKDKGLATCKGARAAYDDPWTKTTHDEQVQAATADGVADSIKVTHRAESSKHARMQAQAAMDVANEARFEGSVTVVGDPTLVAGNTVALAGLGKLSGTYLINSSRHRIGRDTGYSTEMEVRRA